MPKGQKTPGNLKDKVDRDLLHEYLWKNSDRRGMYLGSQKDLAEKLGVTHFTISHIFREMKEGGRVKKVGRYYKITDPDKWRWNVSPSADPRLFE